MALEGVDTTTPIDVEHRAAKMMVDVEDKLLVGCSTSDSDPQDLLKPWVPSWYPTIDGGGRFICETGRNKWLGLIPDGECDSHGDGFATTSNPRLDRKYRGKFTYYHTNHTTTEHGLSLGEWAGGLDNRPWWEGWSLVGHAVLILVERFNGQLGIHRDGELQPPTTVQDGHRFYVGKPFYFRCEDKSVNWTSVGHQRTKYCWMFALVDGWDGDQGTHTLTFRDHGIFYTIDDVNLRNCIFQEWTRPDLRSFHAKEKERFDREGLTKEQIWSCGVLLQPLNYSA